MARTQGSADPGPAQVSDGIRAVFFGRLVQWQRGHGRHDLPWQQTRDPYRVWLSEVMLQQTQVVTVLGYYARFLEAFPDVRALAQAHQDEVLALWAGLGYYSRARNLLRCAQQVCSVHGGEFPRSSTELATLPGIGPSTAVAIAAFCFGERSSILDANVQRVLSRVLGFGEDLSGVRHVRTLWQMANSLIPEDATPEAMAAYTQGLMDLGATVCTPRQPACTACPMRGVCVAEQQGTPLAYPVRSSKLKRTAENWWMLVLRSREGLWLQRRPQQGIWAGLHCLPLFSSEEALRAAIPHHAGRLQHQPMFKHVLTHKDLYLHPVVLDLADEALMAFGNDDRQEVLEGGWTEDSRRMGLPAPVRKWLDAQGTSGQPATRELWD